MNEVVRSFTKNFIKYFFYIAVFAQIVSGTVYLVCNFNGYTTYPETEAVLEAARAFLFDEYTGVLYPVFIRLCLWLGTVSGISYYIFVYIVQMVLWIVAAWYVVKPFFSKKEKWVAILFAITNPMCMQTIFSVSLFALKTVFGLFIFGAMFRLWNQKEKVDVPAMAVLLMSFFLAVFHQPDDVSVWLIPIVVVFAVMFFCKRICAVRKKIGLLLTVIGVLVITLFVTGACIEKGSHGRAEKSIEFTLFQKTVWPDMGEKYTFLPTGIREKISQEKAYATDEYAESFVMEIGPILEKEYGIDKAKELYWQAVITQLQYNKRNLANSLASDFVGYMLEPYSSVWHMSGKSGSAFGKLYGLMLSNGEKSVHTYWCISFVTMFMLALYTCIDMVKRNVAGKNALKKAFPGVVLLVYLAIVYTLVNVQGVDYRYSLLHVILYSVFGLFCFWKERNTQC